MTRYRNRLLITLALFAVASVTVVATASAARRMSEGPVAQDPVGCVAGHSRPSLGPLSGEPDAGNGNSPSSLQKTTPQSSAVVFWGSGPGHAGDVIRLARRLWATWILAR